jgi:RNA polymerase sigma factor (sigma-70 family)
MVDPGSLLSDAQHGRERFLALVGDVRPELHRYCARMTGSVADGEDIVQETLSRAYFLLAELEALPPLRPWLFHIAHNRALDHLRRYEQRMSQPLETAEQAADEATLDPEAAAAREHALHAAITRFVALAPAQRSAVILKDVLDHSLEEIAALLALSVPAVKAALHRGRASLRAAAGVAEPGRTARREASPGVARYAALFNARDWDGVRALLAEDVRLDLVSRAQRSGRDVGEYVTRYAALDDWHLLPAWLDQREVLAVFERPGAARARYFIELTLEHGRVALIRDFRHVPYIGVDLALELA